MPDGTAGRTDAAAVREGLLGRRNNAPAGPADMEGPVAEELVMGPASGLEGEGLRAATGEGGASVGAGDDNALGGSGGDGGERRVSGERGAGRIAATAAEAVPVMVPEAPALPPPARATAQEPLTMSDEAR